MWKIIVLAVLLYFLGNTIITRIAITGKDKENFYQCIEDVARECGIPRERAEKIYFRLSYLFGIPVLVISWFRKAPEEMK